MVRRGTAYEALSLAIRTNSIKTAQHILNGRNGLVIDDTWGDYILLIKALQRGRIRISESLLYNGCRVNKPEKTNFFHTPLYYAVRLRSVRLVELLLEKGAIINGRDFNKDSAFQLAIEKKQYEIIDLLLTRYLDQVSNVSNESNDDCIVFKAACLTNDVSTVENFLNRGFSVDKYLNFGSSQRLAPIHLAVLYQSLDIIDLLTKCKADIHIPNENGYTPLHLAQQARSDQYPSKKSLKVIDKILAELRKGNENCIDNSGLSYFHIACMQDQTDIVEKFLKLNADVNSQVPFDSANWAGYTPLHFATENKQHKVMELLLEHGANMMIKSKEGDTPFHIIFSSFYHDHDLINQILTRYIAKDINPINNIGLSHFHIACSTNNAEAVEAFILNGVSIDARINLDSKKCPGYTPLHFAVNFNQKETVKVLLEHGANVNLQEKEGFTPLHMACQQNAKKIHTLLRQACIACVGQVKFDETFKRSLNKALDIIARYADQEEIVQLLLSHGSNVNAKDHLNKTPLFYACDIDDQTFRFVFGKQMTQPLYKVMNEFYMKRKKIVESLLKYKPDLNIYDSNGNTVLHYIADSKRTFNDERKDEIAELLLKQGADINAKSQSNSTPVHLALRKGYVDLIKVFLKYKVDPNIAEKTNGQTCLHLAITNDLLAPYSEEIIRNLLDKGADIHAQQSDGQTPLHIAASTRFATNRLTPLLELDCDIDCQDETGKTSLHMACINRNAENVQELLNKGADINVVDKNNYTPFYYYYQYQIEVQSRSIREFHRIYYIFKNHIRKLKTLGFHVSWENISYFMKLKDMNVEQENNEDILGQCDSEIEKMKSIWINNYSSLYDILYKDQNQMALYSKNGNLKKIVESNSLKSEFVHYWYLLDLQFRRGIRRNELLKPAKLAFSNIIKLTLPDMCSERIFRYLSNRHLRDLIKTRDVH